MKAPFAKISLSIILTVCLLSPELLKGQEYQIFNHSQYLMNPYLINPAVAGSKDFSNVNISSRQNLASIKGSPRTQIISYHSRLRKSSGNRGMGRISSSANFRNVGLGGFLFNDNDGPFQRLGLQATYAYHVPLEEKRFTHLAFALSVTGYHNRIQYSEFNVYNDPLLNSDLKSTFTTDFNFGILFYTRNLNIGVSSVNLLNSELIIQESGLTDLLPQRRYFFHASYRIRSMKSLLIEPGFLFHPYEEELSEFYENVDINLTAYLGSLSVGLSHRLKESMVARGIYQLDNVYFGLAYQFPFSQSAKYILGTTEVIVGLNYGKGPNRFKDNRYW